MTGGYSIREVISMDNNVTPITVELTARASAEPCNIDVSLLHETLLKMPAEKYLDLYSLMTMTMKIYSPPSQK